MSTCPVPGCAGEPHTCDAMDRHAFDPPEEQGVRLNAWLAPMDFAAPTTILAWTAYTEAAIDRQQKEHANG